MYIEPILYLHKNIFLYTNIIRVYINFIVRSTHICGGFLFCLASVGEGGGGLTRQRGAAAPSYVYI